MWHYSSGGSRHGPVSEQEIAERIAAGEITPTSYVRHDASLDWVEARNTELERYFPDEAKRTAARRATQGDWEERRPANWIATLAGFVIVAGMLGAGVWIAQGGPGKLAEGTAAEQFLPDSMLTDESLAHRLEAEFEQQQVYRETRSLPRMKALFPQDYHAMMLRLVPGYRVHAGAVDAERITRTFLTDFLQRNKAAMLRASPESLSNLLLAETRAMQALQRADIVLCGMAAVGVVGESDFEGRMNTRIRDEADAMNVAMFEAIASGRHEANAYPPIASSEWTAVSLRMIRTTNDPHMMERLSGNFADISPEDRCRLTTALFTTMSSDPDINMRARYGAELARKL
ncbi:MAG: DUF4339 domain-containing protein [Terricaulis sp.]